MITCTAGFGVFCLARVLSVWPGPTSSRTKRRSSITSRTPSAKRTVCCTCRIQYRVSAASRPSHVPVTFEMHARSEERRGGEEGRSRGAADSLKKKKKKNNILKLSKLTSFSRGSFLTLLSRIRNFYLSQL